MLTKLSGFIKSRVFLTQLLIAVLAVFLLLFSTDTILRSVTHHGENIIVPNLHGLKMSQAEKYLNEKSLLYKIVDSLYDMSQPAGTIMDQDPAENSRVKKGRTIYLTINSVKPPKVKMPNLVDVSYRQAEAILQTFGLKVGRLIYKPDLAENAVLDQYYRNAPIKAGTEIYKGSEIDLVLGNGNINSSPKDTSDLNSH
jgi:beta-lactam-binding protein with PASTA domain